ncbi:hypothetical protein FRACYDRAFT_232716 [Fragilariopsis cylindrus CCMP1102]|uniref:Uncharacterized protein n=1 Tax=Fragilariopsis cylindrus CCMP1102 TaxID=635003 RepID=A0A1E7FWM1_9STRA|nr:hypothetical protein FRACYDRAFT_232716 [Fragilariopsis cylindrus CCMP1102]|eukprot:OEU22559.1 hypothetical protein FRACYDRAFT_232716 [Fragilariopsis cylindrus CCMP1102]
MESEAAATSWTEEYNSSCLFVALILYYLSTKQSIYSFLGYIFRTTPNERKVSSYVIPPLILTILPFVFVLSSLTCLLDLVLVKAAAYGQDLSIETSDESLSTFSSPIDTTATIPQDTIAHIAI